METLPPVASAVSGPSGANALRWFARMARDPLTTYADLQRCYGDAVRLPYRRGRPLLLLSRPEHAEQVLVSRQRSFVKSITYRPLAAFLGSGLLTSGGEDWKRHRQIVQPVFARRHLDGFASEIVAATGRTTDAWRTGGPVVDLAAEMRELTLDVIGRVLFGASLGESAPRVAAALGPVQRATMIGVLLAGVVPERMPWAWLRRVPGVAGSAETLDAIVDGIIAQPRREPAPPQPRDLLDLLLGGRDDDGSLLDDTEVRDEVMTLMLAGHETTANALTWTFALLSGTPSIRRRVEAEVEQVLGDRAPGAGDVDNLPFTEAVIHESMRLYPPAWTIEREAIEDVEIAGVPVAAGTTVVVPPYLLHRHPQVWPDPSGFDPERFLTGHDRPRYAFLPFGGGRRICVGAGFAMFEATLMLAGIAQSHRLDLVSPGMPSTLAEITLRPRGRVPVRLVSRQT